MRRLLHWKSISASVLIFSTVCIGSPVWATPPAEFALSEGVQLGKIEPLAGAFRMSLGIAPCYSCFFIKPTLRNQA